MWVAEARKIIGTPFGGTWQTRYAGRSLVRCLLTIHSERHREFDRWRVRRLGPSST